MIRLALLVLALACPARADNLFPAEIKDEPTQKNMDFLYEQYRVLLASVTNAVPASVALSTFHSAGITSTAQPNITSTLGVCATASTRTVTAVGTAATVCYSGGAEFGGGGQGIMGFLVNGAFQDGQSSSEGAIRFSKESAGSANASFCSKATGLSVGTQYNFCLTFASNSPAITVPANSNAGARFYVESQR